MLELPGAPATVDGEDVAGDEAGVGRRQKQGGAGGVLGGTRAAERGSLEHQGAEPGDAAPGSASHLQR